MKDGVDPSPVVIASDDVASDARDVYSKVVESAVVISGTVALTIADVDSSSVANSVVGGPEVGCVSVVSDVGEAEKVELS